MSKDIDIENTQNTHQVFVEGEMKRSYLEYSMSVIVSRALPDVRDGLKPVHRRILYAMAESGFDFNKPYKKSARIVGDVVAKYHPHGTEAVYETMVRMAQDFSMRATLVDGHGNFGSMDGDKPAAMRYTEARLSKIAHSILEDYDRKTVGMQTNYDESLLEPVVLPARFPNILVNGAGGIAVGMATNIPTHNLQEIIDGCCALIDTPDLSAEELLHYIPGPDFPTGGSIMGRRGIISAYKTGRGIIVIRGKSHVEEVRKDRTAIIVTEIPYQVNKAKMLERIAELVNNKDLEGISDLRDESDLKGVRVVIELKKGVMPEVVLNRLYAMTPLQTSFGINMLGILDGKPLQLSLKEILKAFIDFRYEVIVKRTQFFLHHAQTKAHLSLGLLVAIQSIDEVIHLIKTSQNPEEAKDRLMKKSWPVESDVALYVGLLDQSLRAQGVQEKNNYQLSEEQAKALLALRLHRLTGLERSKLEKEIENLAEEIKKLCHLLSSNSAIYQLMKEEMLQIRSQFPMERKTVIENYGGVLPEEDLIQQEDMVVTVSVRGYIKRVSLDTYRSQRRGGRGKNAMNTYDEDAVAEVFMADTHTTIVFFSTFGRAYSIKVHELPLGSAQSKGKPLIGFLPLEEKEGLATFLPLLKEHVHSDTSIIFVTSKGSVRRNALKDFLDIRSGGKNAIRLEGDEKLIAVRLANSNQDVLLSTLHGHSIRFSVEDLRVFSSRTSTGVMGIRLKPSDIVVSMNIVNGDSYEAEQKEWYLKESSLKRRVSTAEEVDDSEILTEHVTANFSEELYAEMESNEQMILSVSSKGFGKRSSAYAYRRTRRGGLGVAVMDLTRKTGDLVDAFTVPRGGGILLLTNNGNLLRCNVEGVRIAGRRTQGVILVRLAKDEYIVSAVPLPEDQAVEEDNVVNAPPEEQELS